MQQTPNAVLSLNRLLNEHNFSTIIELGTHDGGLSTLFALYCLGSTMPAVAENKNEPSLYKNQTHHKQPKKFYTFDICLRDIPRVYLLTQMGATFDRVDFLNDENTIAKIGGLIALPGRTLILCDGGDKKKEFSIYSKYLKSGDVIMAHDWAYNEEANRKNKEAGIWAGWESSWEDGIAESQQFGLKLICEQYGIEPIHREEFDKSVWFCGLKT